MQSDLGAIQARLSRYSGTLHKASDVAAMALQDMSFELYTMTEQIQAAFDAKQQELDELKAQMQQTDSIQDMTHALINLLGTTSPHGIEVIKSRLADQGINLQLSAGSDGSMAISIKHS